MYGYVVMVDGDCWHLAVDQDEAFDVAQSEVNQYICDFYRHKLPMNVEREGFDPDIRVHVLNAASELELPLQKWVDENYQETIEYNEDQEKREYARYLELKEKYENS